MSASVILFNKWVLSTAKFRKFKIDVRLIKDVDTNDLIEFRTSTLSGVVLVNEY